MSHVLRVVKKSHFTTIQNDTIRDKNLSWKATGLLIFLLSFNDNWRFNLADLSNRKIDGETSTRAARDELIAAGYLRVEVVRQKEGKFKSWVWTVFEDPTPPECDFPQLENPQLENPELGNPELENRPLRTIKGRKTNSKKEQPPPQAQDLRFSKIIPEVFQKQISERFSDFSPNEVQAGLDELAAAMAKRQISNPVLWLDGVLKKGLVRTQEGLRKSEQRNAA